MAAPTASVAVTLAAIAAPMAAMPNLNMARGAMMPPTATRSAPSTVTVSETHFTAVISPLARAGFSLAQARTACSTARVRSRVSTRAGLRASPSSLLRLKKAFFAISIRALSVSLRASPSRCIDPLARAAFTSSSWRRYSPMFSASLAASSPYSLPNRRVAASSCFSFGSDLIASRTLMMVPVASLFMPSQTKIDGAR